MKNIFVIAVVFLVCITCFNVVNSLGGCGRKSPEKEALKLAPCALAAQNKTAPVSPSCCTAVTQLGKTPSCLCAVMLSKTAKKIGAKPRIAITIPKRCKITKRPVGYKCGGYTLP